MPSIVTLTTDFEEREPFVASVKGVLYSQCPGVQVVDLSHQIPRSDIMDAALFIAGAVPYFPKGTVHIVGIAPGPTPLVVAIKEQFVVCPDNGVTTLLSERHDIEAARAISIPEALVSREHQIFYGRDVFAPTAARLAAGAAFDDIGKPFDAMVRLDFPKPRSEGADRVKGEIIHVDRFGNLVTNIHRSFLDGSRVTNVEVGHFPLGALSRTYSDVERSKPLALYGGSGYLEVAYNEDRADVRLGMGKGIVVTVAIEPDGA